MRKDGFVSPLQGLGLWLTLGCSHTISFFPGPSLSPNSDVCSAEPPLLYTPPPAAPQVGSSSAAFVSGLEDPLMPTWVRHLLCAGNER